MKRNYKKSLVAIATCFLLCLSISAQSVQFVDHTLVSAYNSKTYRLKILLPARYTASDTVRYPVLYVLDGDYSADLFQSALNIFSLAPELKDVIIITIDGSTKSKEEWLASRYFDYTPSSDPQADTAIAKFMKTPIVPSGGADLFLQTLEKQIMPWVEKTYKTNADNGLYGHSLGGLFAAFTFFKKPTLFRKYSINSPSLWWKKAELSNQFAALNEKKKTINTDVFLSAGKAEGAFMISPIGVFEKALQTNYPSVNLVYKIFDDETHLSVVPVICSRTLRTFYSRTSMYTPAKK